MKDTEVQTYWAAHPHQPGFKGAIIRSNGSDQDDVVKDDDPVFYVGKVLEQLRVPCVVDRSPGKVKGLIAIQFEGGFPD